MKVRDILETCLYVDDLDAADNFYAGALGLDIMSREAERHLFFHCGARVFLLFNAVTTKSADGPLPTHVADGDVHVAFAVSEDELPA